MEDHDDVAHPYDHDPKRRNHPLPTRSEREGVRPKLAIVREFIQTASPGDGGSNTNGSGSSGGDGDGGDVVVKTEIFLRASEMTDQAHAAHIKAVAFRHDGLGDWVLMLFLRACAIIALAIRGAHSLLYVEVMLVFFYDVPVLLAVAGMMQLLIFYSTAANTVHVGWSLYELIKWYSAYLFSAHHRHFNGGIVVGWIGFVVLLCMFLVVLIQLRNLINLTDAVLLHAEVMTTIGDIGRSAERDAAFRLHATSAGQALVGSTGTAKTGAATTVATITPSLLSSSSASSSSSSSSVSSSSSSLPFSFLSNVPVLGRLLMAAVSASPSPVPSPLQQQYASTHVKTT